MDGGQADSSEELMQDAVAATQLAPTEIVTDSNARARQRGVSASSSAGAASSALDGDAGPKVRERYELLRLHETGGIGRIWLARDSSLGREVALKELLPERIDNPAFWNRFLKEAQITGQLEHPAIVPVYELSRRSENQQPFYTMRFVKGRTLTEAVDMVADSVAYLLSRGRGVFVEAEHFFDGYRDNPRFSTSVLMAAAGAGG